jgi:hypothetical protein
MANRDGNLNEILLLDHFFPNLYRFYIKWVDIVFEYSPDWLGFPNENPVKILSVCGFSDPSSYRKHVIDLYLKDFDSFVQSLLKRKKSIQIRQIESLIGEIENDMKVWVTDFRFDGNNFNRFVQWMPTRVQTSLEEIKNIPDEIIFYAASSFAEALLKAMDQFITKLYLTLAKVESGDLALNSKPLLFEYFGLKDDPTGLNDLFDALCKAGFLSNEANSVIEFKSIFSGKRIIREIEWQTPYIEDLYWFIKTLKTENKLKDNGSCWIRTCNCFLDKEGKSYEISQFEGSHKPKQSKSIENLVKKHLKLGKPK